MEAPRTTNTQIDDLQFLGSTSVAKLIGTNNLTVAMNSSKALRQLNSYGNCLNCLERIFTVPKLKSLLSRWPVIKQIQTGGNGTGEEAWSERTRTLQPKTHDCEVSRSVCPYCAVGCGQLIYHKNNKLVAIMGDPESPISRGRLCPKGSATYQLHTHAGRLNKVKYRRPYSTQWESLDLETAMDMIADRVWETRQRTFQENNENGDLVMHTLAMAHLGGATMDVEENYLIKKLFCAGLGMNCISNQARI